MNIRSVGLVLVVVAGLGVCSRSVAGQSMPETAGETLSGKHVRPADAVKGHAAVLIAGFSHDAGMHSGARMKAVEGDPAMKGLSVLELAMLEKAPG